LSEQIVESAASERRLRDVHMFWFGPPLSRLERVCMASFMAHGHRVVLHVYEEPAGVPAGVVLGDAEEILPRSALFSHRRTGSVAIFADWFRYRLLFERGGLWSDTDMVCVRPLDFTQDVIFGWQDASTINNALLGLPRGHEMAAWLAAGCESPNRALPYDTFKMRLRKWKRRVLQGDRRENIRWGETGPKGLTLAAKHLGYAQAALPVSYFYPVYFRDWKMLFQSCPAESLRQIETAYGVHLWNNMTREDPGFDKNANFAADSPYEIWCTRYLTSGS